MKKIIIGSRGSELALWQANFFQKELKSIGIDSEIKIIKTKGDKIQDLSFDKIEGKGFFTKEIEDALITKEIDVAVHSHKDLETTEHPLLKISAVSYREDPSEIMLINKNAFDVSMPLMVKPNAIIGTSSARRKTQLLFYRSDIVLKDLRGNVPTRIQKLKQQQYDAIVLARAGVNRLKTDLSDFFVIPYDPKVFIPAPAQGVLAYQIRKDNQELDLLLQKIHHPEVQQNISIERAVLKALHGGCQLPLGVFCEQKEKNYRVFVSYAPSVESPLKRFYIYGTSPEELVNKAVKLIRQPQPKKVLITRRLEGDSAFKKLLQKNQCQIIEKPLIAIEEQPVENYQTGAEWVFFTSKNAAKIWLEKQQHVKGVNIACIGKSTATEFLKKGIHPAFVGNSDDHSQIADAFVEYAKGKKVVFPSSDKSKQTIQRFIEKYCKVENLILYKTVPNPQRIDENYDIAIFTSPSNVEAFFKMNKLPENVTVIAIGNTTKNKLKEYTDKSVITPWEWSELALADTVLGL
ncbi:MAG: hydroxymethylbilane synthase [Bacteroidetes bacterium]|nr:MAG: hydroxymethylbilane synthase [Bacteroidota bacterium]